VRFSLLFFILIGQFENVLHEKLSKKRFCNFTWDYCPFPITELFQVGSEWNAWDLFPIREMNKASALDENSDAKPITHDAVTPDEVLASFNALSYSKVSSSL